jgi:hypothetical protein
MGVRHSAGLGFCMSAGVLGTFTPDGGEPGLPRR